MQLFFLCNQQQCKWQQWLLVVNPELVCAALSGHTATLVTLINNKFLWACINCIANEFVLNKKEVGLLLRSGFVIMLSPH
ncbi:MAG: hypothetical protein EAZ16_07760 [Sphingobacteriales bacterium]|nr:MAG: hypothetical protein EAZ16_07760 [Sphingobacteriales bacterium]